MMKEATNNKGSGVVGWLRNRLIYMAGLLLAIVIVFGVVYAYMRYPQIFKNPDFFPGVEQLRYLSVFIISVILNATIILPVSNMTIIAALGATLSSPLFVGLAGGIGAGIGEMTGYIAGRSGRGLLTRSTVYNRLERWVRRWGWIAVFILSIFPLFFDIVGIIAGAMRMPSWRFFVACWLGRTISYVTVAYLASFGLKLVPWLR